jgi:Domain of unknown function (DUF1815)
MRIGFFPLDLAKMSINKVSERRLVFYRLSDQYRQFVRELIVNLQALAIVLERRGYIASCYTWGDDLERATFIVNIGPEHLIRLLVSDYGISWTEIRDDREMMKLEGAEAIGQLQELMDRLSNPESARPSPLIGMEV